MKNYLKYFLLLCVFAQSAQAFAAQMNEFVVKGKKITTARNSFNTGASSYSFNEKDIENLPQGHATPLNQLLLRAPGVAQDSFGQIHVRNDHSNVQYRINGVMLPDGVGGFGQMFDVHFIESVNLITGALPAQYGYRTAGVIDIKTKGDSFENGGHSEVMVGGYNTTQLNQEISGSQGKLNYYLNANYLTSDRSVGAPTKSRHIVNGDGQQEGLFGYFSYLYDAKTKLNFIVGNSKNIFHIPNNPNQKAGFVLNGTGDVSSLSLNQKQIQRNSYAIVALQGATDSQIDYQLSAFARQSALRYRGDDVGDLVFTGVASDIDKTSLSTGLQGDFTYKINEKNTLRSGFNFINENVRNYESNLVFDADADGLQTGFDPFRISQKNNKSSQFYGFYLQNEWRALDKLTLNYGARYDVSSSYIDSSHLSPRVNAVYDLTDATKLHAGYARFFTVPQNELLSNSTLQIYQNTTNAPNSLNNGFVRPERTNYYDIGITHQLNKQVNLGLSGYYKDIYNLLDKGQFGESFIFTSFNYKRSKAYGVEFTTDYKNKNLSSYLNLAYQIIRAKKINSTEYLFAADEINYINNNYIYLDHQQQLSASMGVAYTWNLNRISADGFFGNGLRKDFANTGRLPSYLQINTAIAREFSLPLVDKFNLRFTILNLLDRAYKIRDGSGVGVSAAQYSQRRTFYVTISKSF